MTAIYTFIKDYRWYFKCLCALGLLGFLGYMVDVTAVLPYLSQVNTWLFVLFAMYVVSLGLGTLRWRLFMPQVTFGSLFVTAWIGNFFSNFLPSSIGGDSYRVVALREQVGLKVVATSVLLDRLSGVVAIVLVGVPMCFVLAPTLLPTSGSVLIGLGTLAGAFVLQRLSRGNKKVQAFILSLHGLLRGTRRQFIYASLISVVYLGLGAVSLWLYYWMFDYRLSLAVVFGLYAIVQLVELLPISINSLGVREGMLVFLFSLVGVPGEVSLGIAIVSRLVLLAQTAIGGLLYLTRR